MPRVVVTPVDAPGPYATTGVVIAFNVSDAAQGNYVPLTGREILIAQNLSGAGATVTIDSVDDPFTREGDITADAIADGALRVWQLFPIRGWKQTDGNLHINTSHNNVKLCVLRLPVDVR